jgi:hypothetical protein
MIKERMTRTGLCVERVLSNQYRACKIYVTKSENLILQRNVVTV